MNENFEMLRVEQRNVNQVVAEIPGAKDALYQNNISATRRFSLRNAAAAAGANTDELLAVLNYRMRRMARQTSRETARVEEEEAELVV